MADQDTSRSTGRLAHRTRENYEVDYWSNKFGVSSERLEQAVKAVGNSPDAVKRNLKG